MSKNGNLPPGVVIPVLVDEEEAPPPPPPPPPQHVVVGSFSNPRHFSGAEHEDVDEWLSDYGIIADANGWDERRSVQRMPLYLEGTAKIWYKNQFGRAVPETVEELVTKMKHAFSRYKPEVYNFDRMSERKMTMTETPVQYAYEKLQLCQRLDSNMSEASKITHIVQGLEKSYKQEVYDLKFETVDELIEKLNAKAEARSHCQPIPQFSAEQDSMRRQAMKEREQMQLRQERREKDLCYGCGSAQHKYRDCPKRPPRNQRQGRDGAAGSGNGRPGGQ